MPSCFQPCSNYEIFLPDFELIFKGSDAMDRNGVFYAISENDHPVTKLLQLPFKAQPATNVLISLNKQQVRVQSSVFWFKNELLISTGLGSIG